MIPYSLITAASFTPNLMPSPSAWQGHLPFAAWVINEVSPKIFVELGTHSGNSYFSFCQAVVETSLATKCYAVDTWQGDEHAGHYNEEIFAKVNAHHQEHYAGFSRLLRMTFDDAATCFADESIDLLHIDGLHTYEAVRHDFESWLPKLAPGAVVMFHDTNVRERNFGVWKLWEELQVCYPNNLEFVHCHGLGVLQLNSAPGEKKLEWLQLEAHEKKVLTNYFAALGSKQVERYELHWSYKPQIASLKQAVHDKEVHIVNLDSDLRERNEQIASLSRAVAGCDEQITSLSQAVHDKDIHIGNLDRDLSERGEQISKLNQASAEIRGSTSWRITRPVRFIGRQLLQTEIFLKALSYALPICGGYLGLVKHVSRTYKYEGFIGIKRRILFSASPGAQIPIIEYAPPAHNDYGAWVSRYDTLTDQDREKIKTRISQLDKTPLISVLMPVYNPPLNMLEDAICSVQDQLYPNWELCIADDASTDVGVQKMLQRYAANDSRIKVVFRKVNGHISAASNSALELVSGEYVALLDNDDLLPEQALFWIADSIVTNPDAGLIYSDEDKLDATGQRYSPYFKSDWNPDLFLSHNMICHFGVYRTDLVRKLAGFREGYEGSQDYDLALRFTELLAPQQIVHIPRVLYHWRSHPGSTAQAGREKHYALVAGERALNDHFLRTHTVAKAELTDFGTYRVRYSISTPAPLVTLIIPTRNGLDLIKQCIKSILAKTSYKNCEILIVDNNSDDIVALAYFASLAENKQIRVLRDERPFNYSALNNAAVQQARGEYICLVNNDIEVISPEWLEEMMGLATQPGIGVVGARLWYPNNTLQHGGVITGLGGVAGHSHKHLHKGSPGYFNRAQITQTLSAVTAACFAVKKSIYQDVGGLDETNLKVAFNDVDFCLRVREAGFRNVWTPYAELYHYESATRGYEDTPEKQLRFREEVLYMQKRWGDSLTNDPAYSPNLTLDREDFSYAWPPRVAPI